jgi:hypothetical protein
MAEAQMKKMLHAVDMPDRFHLSDCTVAIMKVDKQMLAACDGGTSIKVTERVGWT